MIRTGAFFAALLAQAALFAAHNVPISQLDLTNVSGESKKAVLGAKFDGSAMRIGGRTLWGGHLCDIGMHSNSRLEIPLGTGALRLSLSCAVDDKGGDGAVVFRILADGKVVADSGVMRRGDEPKPMNVDLKGVSACTLEVLDGGDGTNQTLRLQALGQMGNINRTIQQIEEALHRIEDGTYGVCTSCGQLIRKPRLMNQPFVLTCMECQSEMERGLK